MPKQVNRFPVNRLEATSNKDVGEQNLQLQEVQSDDEPDEESGEINSLAIHYPHALNKQAPERTFISLIGEDLTIGAYNYLSGKDKRSFSLIDWTNNNIYKKRIFPKKLRAIPQVQEHAKNGVLLSEMPEKMQIQNDKKLVEYLAKKALKAGGFEKNSEKKLNNALIAMAFKNALVTLAKEGCPTAQYRLGMIFYFDGLQAEVNNGLAELNYQVAISWLEKAASRFAKASEVIVRIYERVPGLKIRKAPCVSDE